MASRGRWTSSAAILVVATIAAGLPVAAKEDNATEGVPKEPAAQMVAAAPALRADDIEEMARQVAKSVPTNASLTAAFARASCNACREDIGSETCVIEGWCSPPRGMRGKVANQTARSVHVEQVGKILGHAIDDVVAKLARQAVLPGCTEPMYQNADTCESHDQLVQTAKRTAATVASAKAVCLSCTQVWPRADCQEAGACTTAHDHGVGSMLAEEAEQSDATLDSLLETAICDACLADGRALQQCQAETECKVKLPKPTVPPQPVLLDPNRPHVVAVPPMSGKISGTCFEQDASYLPLDIPGIPPAYVEDAATCQAVCDGTKGCEHFIFSVADHLCHVTDGKVLVPGSVGLVAGPAKCQQDETMVSAVARKFAWGSSNILGARQGTFSVMLCALGVSASIAAAMIFVAAVRQHRRRGIRRDQVDDDYSHLLSLV